MYKCVELYWVLYKCIEFNTVVYNRIELYARVYNYLDLLRLLRCIVWAYMLLLLWMMHLCAPRAFRKQLVVRSLPPLGQLGIYAFKPPGPPLWRLRGPAPPPVSAQGGVFVISLLKAGPLTRWCVVSRPLGNWVSTSSNHPPPGTLGLEPSSWRGSSPYCGSGEEFALDGVPLLLLSCYI